MRFCSLMILCTNFWACNSRSKAFDLEAGTATASVDGEKISYTSTWTQTGNALQLNLQDTSFESMMTIRLLESDEGIIFGELSQFPALFSLSESHKGLATYYPPDSNPSATTEGNSESFFEIEEFEAGYAIGNFSFIATDQNDQTYEVTSGLIHANELDITP